MNKKEVERMLLNEVIDELYDSKIMTTELHEAIGALNEKYISEKAKIKDENKQMLEEVVREVTAIEEEQIEEAHEQYLDDLRALINNFLSSLNEKKEEVKEENVQPKQTKYVTRENGQIIIKIKGINE